MFRSLIAIALLALAGASPILPIPDSELIDLELDVQTTHAPLITNTSTHEHDYETRAVRHVVKLNYKGGSRIDQSPSVFNAGKILGYEENPEKEHLWNKFVFSSRDVGNFKQEFTLQLKNGRPRVCDILHVHCSPWYPCDVQR